MSLRQLPEGGAVGNMTQGQLKALVPGRGQKRRKFLQLLMSIRLIGLVRHRQVGDQPHDLQVAHFF